MGESGPYAQLGQTPPAGVNEVLTEAAEKIACKQAEQTSPGVLKVIVGGSGTSTYVVNVINGKEGEVGVTIFNLLQGDRATTVKPDSAGQEQFSQFSDFPRIEGAEAGLSAVASATRNFFGVNSGPNAAPPVKCPNLGS